MKTIDPELDAIRAGDERAFEALTRRHYPAMFRIALARVRDRQLAEDVVQETWITFLRRLPEFEGRSSLKTWLFGILNNVARSRRRRESRLLRFTDLLKRDASDSRRPTVDPSRFTSDGHWRAFPAAWSRLPEEVLESRETLDELQTAIDELPPKLREVIVLRDVAGWSAGDVCDVLSISEANQRVRLHRARAAVRRALEASFE